VLSASIAAKEPKAGSTQVSLDRAHIVLPVQKDGQLAQSENIQSINPPSTVGHKSPASSREGSLAEGEGKSGGLSVRGSTRVFSGARREPPRCAIRWVELNTRKANWG